MCGCVGKAQRARAIGICIFVAAIGSSSGQALGSVKIEPDSAFSAVDPAPAWSYTHHAIWINPGGGDWYDPNNWAGGKFPDSGGIADFGTLDIVAEPVYVFLYLGQSASVSQLIFGDTNPDNGGGPWIIAGGGSIYYTDANTPEPAAVGLLMVGAVMLLGRRARP